MFTKFLFILNVFFSFNFSCVSADTLTTKELKFLNSLENSNNWLRIYNDQSVIGDKYILTEESFLFEAVVFNENINLIFHKILFNYLNFNLRGATINKISELYDYLLFPKIKDYSVGTKLYPFHFYPESKLFLLTFDESRKYNSFSISDIFVHKSNKKIKFTPAVISYLQKNIQLGVISSGRAEHC